MEVMETPAPPSSSSSAESNNVNNKSHTWSSESNWVIAHGSFQTTITCESSESLVEEEEDDDDDVQYQKKPPQPLVLRPPSSDSHQPCEIKICFLQKQDIQQVYVRSSARVYEIYRAPSLQSGNEYLCTVRCGLAERDGECLQTNIEVAQGNMKGSTGELTEQKLGAEGNIGTSEDDWVEVKVLDTPVSLDNGINVSSKKNNAERGISIQDLYEATAQISDADPCTCLTIRLLSLQNKDCVYVDEVYIFSDPVESTDSQNQAIQAGPSAGSSLMAMLVPTLLQLSRSGVSQKQEKLSSDKLKEPDPVESGNLATRPANAINVADDVDLDYKSNESEQHLKLEQIDAATAEPDLLQLPSLVQTKEQEQENAARTNLPHVSADGVLEQLVSRVGRIEEICLRLEANMLKPIHNIEMRLQRVEQQLEVLARNSHYSVLPSCTRISAPAFSCSQSNSSSLYDGMDNAPPEALVVEKNDTCQTKYSNPSGDISISANAPHYYPSLVVTAPEFPSVEEEEISVLEPAVKSEPEKPRKVVSIDDVLASALSGFLLTSKVSPSDHTQVLESGFSVSTDIKGNNLPLEFEGTAEITAPEVTCMEDGNLVPSNYTQHVTVTSPELTADDNLKGEKTDSGGSPSVIAPEFPIHQIAVGTAEVTVATGHYDDGYAGIDNEVPTSKLPSSGCAEQHVIHIGDDQVRKASQVVNAQEEPHESSPCSSVGNGVDGTSEQGSNLGGMDNSQALGDSSHGGSSNFPVREINDDLRSRTATSPNILDSASQTTECFKIESEKDLLQKQCGSSCSLAVDSEIPILDVKFIPNETLNNLSPLEALLSNTVASSAESSSDQSDGVMVDEQTHTIVMDGYGTDPVTNGHLLLDFGNYALESLDMEDGLQGTCLSSNQEMFASLI